MPVLTPQARIRTATVASAAVLTLALASCSSTPDTTNAGGSQTGGEGVAYGASLEEWQAAFADVDPIALRFQTSGPEGSLANLGLQEYGDALEEYSDGKITIEWGHSSSFVPAATEWNIGFSDGRIDAGLFLPYYNPDIFPELNNLTSATFLDGNAPTSTLVSSAWVTDALFSLPVYQEEAAANGVHILALGPSVSFAAMFCTEPRSSLADFEGVQISASGSGRVAELTALGFSPQSVAFTELYEALERGIVQCGSSVPTAIESIGAIELVPHAIADPVAALTGFPSFVAVSQAKWESMPLVAQQLFTDRIDAFLVNEPIGQGERVTEWLDQAIDAGGGIEPLDKDAREALLEANDALLADLEAQGTDVDALQETFDKWNTTINDDLYPDITDSLQDFLLEGGYGNLDYQPFVDAVFDEILLEHRPN